MREEISSLPESIEVHKLLITPSAWHTAGCGIPISRKMGIPLSLISNFAHEWRKRKALSGDSVEGLIWCQHGRLPEGGAIALLSAATCEAGRSEVLQSISI